MNPGLVVKLRPAGPWRIGPDSGARNRVDAIYHSDSLYSAVTSAMSRMGSLAEWLDATARSQAPAVCFSSCYPFLDDLGFVVPPRPIWPPTSPAAMAARVRWKSARFIPLSLVESMLAGKRLNDNQWSVDGPSGCLVPAGKPGPFRTSVRWNAAVDRLSGASDRYSTACIEFREGCGLWTVAGFRDDAARDQWQESVKAAFRLLADSGFGGERSRGWGRAETPEFVEGTLPGLIVEYQPKAASPAPPIEEPPSEEPPITEPPPAEEPVPDPEPPMEAEPVPAGEPAPQAGAVAPESEPAAEAESAAPPVESVTPAGEPIRAANVRERLPEAEPAAEAATSPAAEEVAAVTVPAAEAAPDAEAAAPELQPAIEPESPAHAPATDAAAPLVGQADPEGAPLANADLAPAPEAEAAALELQPAAEPESSAPARSEERR